jgi:hypothetical protein
MILLMESKMQALFFIGITRLKVLEIMLLEPIILYQQMVMLKIIAA